MTDQAVAELVPLVGVRAACAAVGEAQRAGTAATARARRRPGPRGCRTPAACPQ
jgi:hypothetical protein